MTGLVSQRRHSRMAAPARRGGRTPSQRPAVQPHLPRGPLASAGTVPALQRSIGNQAVLGYLATVRPGAGHGLVQRRIERGWGTGWGFPGWVSGGEALWNRIEKGFNTDLFDVRDELSDLQSQLDRDQPARAAIDSALQAITDFMKVWDGRKYLYYAANPAQSQPISAAEFADKVDRFLACGNKAIAAAASALAVAEPAEPEAESRPELQSAPTPAPEPASPPVPMAQHAPPEPAVTPAPAPAATPSRKQRPKAKPKAKPKARAAAPGPSDVLEAQKKEKANRRRELGELRAAVDAFGTNLQSATKELVASEKLDDFKFRQTWSTDLERLVRAARGKVDSADKLLKQLRLVYDTWTKILDVQRSSASAWRDSPKQWQTWTGIDGDTIVEHLPEAHFTPAPDSPTGASGAPVAPVSAPASRAPAPIPIHVTYDARSVRAPIDPVHDKTPPEVVNHVLSVGEVGHRIHGTLESTIIDKFPHVYWGGSDLGYGSERFPDWAHARPKVEQVLNDYVSSTVVPKVKSHMASWRIKPYTWPTFESLVPPGVATKPAVPPGTQTV